MATAANLPIVADRVGACVRTIVFRGLDLTGVALAMQVRLAPDTPGAPLIDLALVTVANAQGLRFTGVTNDGGVPVSTVVLRINETTMKDATKVPYFGEPGAATVLAYGLIGTFSGDKRSLAYGDFVAVPTTFGSDSAATSGSSASLGRGYSTWSAATLSFAGDTVLIAIDGVDLLAPLVKAATDAAAQAIEIQAEIEGSQATFNTNAALKTSDFNAQVAAVGATIGSSVTHAPGSDCVFIGFGASSGGVLVDSGKDSAIGSSASPITLLCNSRGTPSTGFIVEMANAAPLREAIDNSIGGVTTDIYAARAGAPGFIRLAGDTMPADTSPSGSGPVAVTPYPFPLFDGYGTPVCARAIVADIPGTLLRNADGSFSFVRDNAGSAFATSATTTTYQATSLVVPGTSAVAARSLDDVRGSTLVVGDAHNDLVKQLPVFGSRTYSRDAVKAAWASIIVAQRGNSRMVFMGTWFGLSILTPARLNALIPGTSIVGIARTDADTILFQQEGAALNAYAAANFPGYLDRISAYKTRGWTRTITVGGVAYDFVDENHAQDGTHGAPSGLLHLADATDVNAKIVAKGW